MVARQRLMELQERKRMLVAEGEVHRAVVEVELEGLRSSLSWVETAGKLAGKGLPWMPVVAAVAGLVVARKSRGVFGLLRSGLAVVPLLRRLIGR